MSEIEFKLNTFPTKNKPWFIEFDGNIDKEGLIAAQVVVRQALQALQDNNMSIYGMWRAPANAAEPRYWQGTMRIFEKKGNVLIVMDASGGSAWRIHAELMANDEIVLYGDGDYGTPTLALMLMNDVILGILGITPCKRQLYTITWASPAYCKYHYFSASKINSY